MRLIDYIAIIVIGVLAYLFVDSKLNPEVVIKKDVKHIPGDTVTVVIGKEKFDSLKYVFKAKLDSIITTKTANVKSVVDTLRDTVYQYYSSGFNLGTNILVVKGRVHFNTQHNKFTFDSLCN